MATLAEQISTLITNYLTLVNAALEAEGRPVGRVYNPAPGLEVAWDDCCAGQLYARVQSVAPNATPGLTAAGPCGIAHLIATVAIGVLRCAHTVDDYGNPPTPVQVSSDGQVMLQDMSTVFSVIGCEPYTRSVVGWSPTTVEGGCHGGEWSFTLRLENCECSS